MIDERAAAIPESVVSPGGLGPVDRLFVPGELALRMVAGNPLRCSAVTIRIAAHRDVGGFDPSLEYVVDWDFWLRVSRIWKLKWFARRSVAIRWHSSSETHRFKTGTADLDETVRLLEQQLFAFEWKDRPDAVALRREANARLARAFLNRASDGASCRAAGSWRDALRRGIDRSPTLIGVILRDPRLCIQMASSPRAPRLAARLFGRQGRSGSTGFPRDEADRP